MFHLKINLTKRQAILAASFSLVAAIYTTPSFAVTDPVVLTFSTVGDSRQDPQTLDVSNVEYASMKNNGSKCPITSGTGLTNNPGLSGQDCKWLQNSKAWSRIMRTIQSQKPNLLFFNGDMIMGYGKAGVPVTRTSTGASEAVLNTPAISDVVTSDLMQIYQQYAFWRGTVANLMETGIYVVPVPGNHEVQCKRCSKKAQVENENAWRDNMGDLILDTTRFTTLLGTSPQNWSLTNIPTLASDGLTTDQTQLSYSFDVGASHFVVINTDPVGNDTHAPTNWLSADLTAAESHGAKRIYVFGHKPAFFYNYTGSAPSAASSLELTNSSLANAFWNVITKHKATYFAGHEHIYNVNSYHSTDGLNNSAYQVVVGAGGSPFEDANKTGQATTDRMYSWATVKVFQSGKVQMDTWGFDDTMNNPVVKLESIQLP